MNRYPFIPFAISFVTGIILGKLYLTGAGIIYHIIIFILFNSVFAVYLYRFKIKISKLIIFNIIVLSGAYYFTWSQSKLAAYPFEKAQLKKAEIYGKIDNINLLRQDKIEFVLNVDSVKTEDTDYKKNFKALVKITDERFNLIGIIYNNLAVGNYIKLVGRISEPKSIRNPGDFDYKKYLISRDIPAIIYVSNLDNLKIIANDIDYWKNALFVLRKKIDSILKTFHTQETYALLRSLLLADRGELDYGLKQSFINAGVVHVLAVSGLHVGFIVLIFLLLFNRFNVYLKYIFTIAGVLFFMFLTGAQPPVFRASVMALIIIIALLTNRSTNSYNSLALAAFIILLINPGELFNPGFQLSFSAVLSIIFFYPEFQKYIYTKIEKDGIPRKILLFGAVSLSSQIGTLPFTLLYFHKLSVIAILINLAVIPLIGFVLGLGITVIITSLFSQWLALMYASANNFLVHWMNKIIVFFGSNKYSYLDIHNFTLFDTILFYLLLVVLVVLLPGFQSRKGKIILTSLVILNFLIYSRLDDKSFFEPGKLNILVFDAGRGQSVLFHQDKTNVLFNGGIKDSFYDFGESIIFPFMKSHEINKVNFGVVSKLERELYGGFYSLIKHGTVDKLFIPEINIDREEEMILNEFIRYYKLPVFHHTDTVYQTGNIKFLPVCFIKSDFLHSKKNGIFVFSYGNISVLLGDIETKQELDNFALIKDLTAYEIWILRLKYKYLESIIKSFEKNLPRYLIVGFSDKYLNKDYYNIIKKLGFDNRIKVLQESGAVLLSSDGAGVKLIDWRNNY